MLFLKVLMRSDQQRRYDTRERLKVTKVLEETMHVDQQIQGSYLEKNVERSSFHDCHSFSDKWRTKLEMVGTRKDYLGIHRNSLRHNPRRSWLWGIGGGGGGGEEEEEEEEEEEDDDDDGDGDKIKPQLFLLSWPCFVSAFSYNIFVRIKRCTFYLKSDVHRSVHHNIFL